MRVGEIPDTPSLSAVSVSVKSPNLLGLGFFQERLCSDYAGGTKPTTPGVPDGLGLALLLWACWRALESAAERCSAQIVRERLLTGLAMVDSFGRNPSPMGLPFSQSMENT